MYLEKLETQQSFYDKVVAMPNKAGIYCIRCSGNGRFYIGSSGNIRTRLKQHWSGLNSNKAHNQYLQNAWNKYGSSSFSIEVLELVPHGRESLLAREQYWIDSLNAIGEGFNIAQFTNRPDPGYGLKRNSFEDRNQITITLSDRAMEEFALVAQYKGIPLATHIRQKLEEIHDSPSYGNLVKRAKEWAEDQNS